MANEQAEPVELRDLSTPDDRNVSLRFRIQRERRIEALRLGVPPVLATLGDRGLEEDAKCLAAQLGLGGIETENMVRGAFVARDAIAYDRVAQNETEFADKQLKVTLTEAEKKALREEKDKLFSETGILRVNIAVSSAAFLQGFVQSSINGASLYKTSLGINEDDVWNDWVLGITNAMPFLTAALLGCWLATPVNERYGRRGAMMISAVLILASSLVSGLTVLCTQDDRWKILLGIRVINGLGMGIKAVSTPILASETAIRFWRGSFLLAWQLWVACGIMIGFLVNIIIATALQHADPDITLGLILGEPLVPALILFGALWSCPESPRYYMRYGSRNYSLQDAYEAIRRLRTCELLAFKDYYLLYKTIEEEYNGDGQQVRKTAGVLSMLKDLFIRKRLRNALISSSTVALSQQLCGINVLAFYSGTFFIGLLNDPSNSDPQNPLGGGNEVYNTSKILQAMGLSLGFGLVNFLFGLPAIRTIDTLGRRRWLILTLPVMCFFLAVAALAFPIPYTDDYTTDEVARPIIIRIVAFALYLHAVAYSPGLGPIPFTLASESFPLSHREIGCAFAISVNLLFSGLLSLSFPRFYAGIKGPGTLGLFCGLTFVAWVLVYFLVEETKELSLENLHAVFDQDKRTFIYEKATELLDGFRRYGLRDPTRRYYSELKNSQFEEDQLHAPFPDPPFFPSSENLPSRPSTGNTLPRSQPGE